MSAVPGTPTNNGGKGACARVLKKSAIPEHQSQFLSGCSSQIRLARSDEISGLMGGNLSAAVAEASTSLPRSRLYVSAVSYLANAPATTFWNSRRVSLASLLGKLARCTIRT